MQCGKLKTYMETGRVVFLPARVIRPNPQQPRQIFEEQALAELAESIARHGILQPLSVRRVGNFYELIAGERRLRAAQLAGLSEVPCILLSVDEEQSALVALVENLQRQDLDFVEECRGIARLMELQRLSQEQTARILGKSQSAIANKLRLLRHGDEILERCRDAGLTERHARALLALDAYRDKLTAIEAIQTQRLSVAQTEAYVEQLRRKTREKSGNSVNLGRFFNHLNRSLAKIQASGVPAISERTETESQIVLTITIPK